MPGDPRAGRSRSGFALGDVLLTLAVLALVASLVWPVLRRASFERRVARAIHDVDAVRASARRYQSRYGTWPPGALPGRIPPELAAELPAEVRFTSDGYRLLWNRWSAVAPEAAPPVADQMTDSLGATHPTVVSLGSITLRTADPSLLAALLDHYGPSVSFARDSSWTLMVQPTDPEAPVTDSFGGQGSGNAAEAHIH